MPGEELARAFVTIQPDFSQFDSQLKAQLQSSATSIEQAFAGLKNTDTSGLTNVKTAATQATSAVTDLGKQGQASAKALTANFTDSAFALQRLGNTLTRYVSGPVQNIIESSIKTVSDLTEATQASEPAFEGASAAVQAWARNLDTSFGLTQKAALDTANSFGLLFGNIGLTDQAAASLAETLAERAADVGSLFNVNSIKVAQDFTSAIEGQSRTVRKYGVLLSEAAVKEEAYRSGITAQGEALTEADKIQARANILLDQTSKAQGDAARTVNTFAGQIRQLRPELEKAQVAIGSALLPAATAFLHIFEDVIDVFNALPGGLRDVVVAFGLIGAAIGPVIIIAAQFANAMRVLGLESLPQLGTSVTAAIQGFFGFSSSAETATTATGALATSVTAEATANEALVASLGEAGAALVGYTEGAQAASVANTELATSAGAAGAATGGAAAGGLARFITSAGGISLAIGGTILAIRGLSGELNKIAGTTPTALDALATGIKKLDPTTIKNIGDALKNSFGDGLGGPVGRATEQVGQFFGNFFGIDTKLKTSNDTIDKVRKSLIDLGRTDLQGARDQAAQLTLALDAQGVSASEIQRLLGPVNEALYGTASAEKDAGDATDTTNESLKTQTTLLSDILNLNSSIRQDKQTVAADQTAVNKANREYNDLLKTNGINQDDINQKTTAYAEAQEKVADKMQAVTDRINDQTQAARTLAAANQDLIDAQAKLDDLLKPATADELSAATDKVTEAQLHYNAAVRDGIAAQRQLDHLDQLHINVAGLSLDQLRETLANQRRGLDATNRENDISDTRQTLIDKVTQSQIDQRDATRDLVQATSDLNDLQNKGLVDTPAIIAAKNGVRDAQDRVKTATQGVADAATAEGKAEREVADAQRDELTAHDNLVTAQAGDPEFNQKLAEKKQAVADATNNLHDALEKQAIDQGALNIYNKQGLTDDQRKYELLQNTLDVYRKFGDLDPSIIDVLKNVLPDTLLAAGTVNIGTINTTVGAAPGPGVNNSLNSRPTLPFEEGGLITQPTRAIMGEKYRPELILPLADPARSWELLAPHLPKITRKAMKSPSAPQPGAFLPAVEDSVRASSRTGGSKVHTGEHTSRDLLTVMRSVDDKLGKLVDADPSVTAVIQGKDLNEDLLLRKVRREVEKTLAERRGR